jgi:hypothetical protein
MQFKQPEILYFLFLLVIPILVHLFQLRRFKKEYFTNVRFLKELSIQTRKSSKIKKWLLLASRLLLLTFLIFAFSQPYFPAKDKKNKNNELFIVLDNSFSMQAKGQKGELLKRVVQDLLENTPENQPFSLITNDETYWNTDIKSITKELQNLKYSATPFQIESAMSKIKARKSNNKKEVVFVTDALGIEKKQLKSIENQDQTYFVVPKSEQQNNISIDSVYMHQSFDDFYEIGVKLTAFGDNQSDIPLGLYNQNKLIAKTLVHFDENSKLLFFKLPKKDFNGYFSISDPVLNYDNTLYFSISEPSKTTVLSIGESSKNNFLSRIFTPDEFEYLNTELRLLDFNLIEKQDAIVLNELKEIPQSLQTTLKSFVEKGGHLIVIPSFDISISNLNSFVSLFDASQFRELENKNKKITSINFNHPIFERVFDKEIDNFQYPNTKKSFQISSLNSPILSYEDQSIFLTNSDKDLGSVYLFAAPLNLENSNFQNSPLIVPAFYNMAQNATKSGINSLTIGDNKDFVFNASLSKDQIVSLKSTNEKFIPSQQILSNSIKLSFADNPELAGNFGIYSGNELLKNISFNFSRTEGDLRLADGKIVSDYKKLNSIESLFNSLETDRSNNILWKWFIILTLLFLVIEVFIQKYVK